MFEKLKGKKVFVTCSFTTESSAMFNKRGELAKGSFYTGVLNDFDNDWIMLDNNKIINKKYIINIKAED